MHEKLLVQQCAPTLSGLKTGNMFSCPFKDDAEMKESLRKYNRIFTKKGLRVLPLRKGKNSSLIYVYRPSALSCDLANDVACRILNERGYNCEKPQLCIKKLMNKLKKDGNFPHEIGLFLGYPPEDVEGFINNKAQNCKMVGCWKVYGDENAAKQKFECYKKCTAACCKNHENGCPLDKLAVCIA